MLVATMSIALIVAGSARAAIISGQASDGHAVTATVDFMAEGDLLTVKLSNTSTAHDFAELLTGIEFELSGLTPTLSSVTGVIRNIDSDGTFSDGSSPQNLSWSLKALGNDLWQLNFHPNARHAIAGPPVGGTYDANRSVAGNPGHNPYVAEMAVAQLNVPGIGDATAPRVRVTGFLFAGELSAAEGRIIATGPLEIPEPATWGLGILGATLLTRAHPTTRHSKAVRAAA
jgi:hypothetical protein